MASVSWRAERGGDAACVEVDWLAQGAVPAPPAGSADLLAMGVRAALAETWDYEGGQGLSRAFLGAGTRSVLASRWSVDDAATEVLIDLFYKEYFAAPARPPDDRDPWWKAEALPKAMDHARKTFDGETWPYAHPWAGFAFQGMPD